jgi:hypothetical protein
MADMAAAVWTACTKLLFAGKKCGAPESCLLRGFCCFMGIFEGCFGKCGCLRVVFCGEVVVNCVVKHGGLMVVFRELKFFTFWKNFCGKLDTDRGTLRSGASLNFLELYRSAITY